MSAIHQSFDLAASTNTTLLTVGAGKEATVTVSLCNRTTSAISVRLATAAADSPTNAEYIEYGVSVPANGVLERGGIVLPQNKKIVAWANSTGISANVWGYDK